MSAALDPARFDIEFAEPRGVRQAFVRVNPGGVPLLCVHGWPEAAHQLTSGTVAFCSDLLAVR